MAQLCVMEGSDLENVLETVYASIGVGVMLKTKISSRAIRGHFLEFLTLMSMLHEEFWERLPYIVKSNLTSKGSITQIQHKKKMTSLQINFAAGMKKKLRVYIVITHSCTTANLHSVD